MRARKPLRIELNRMENNETPMIEWYWNKVRGILCAEFPIAKRRKIDAVILPDKKRVEEVDGDQLSKLLNRRDVIVVQAKAKRLGMPLMGQSLFSAALVKQEFDLGPVRPIAIALCREDDPILRPLLKSVAKKIGVDMKVVGAPKSFQESNGSRPPGTSMICRYWDQIRGKGKLFEKFRVTDNRGTGNTQVVRALILPDEAKEWIRWNARPASEHEAIGRSLRNCDVTVVHAEAKLKRISMSLMGEALFSAMLVKQRFRTRPIRSVALCEEDDDILHPLLVSVGKKVGISIEIREIPRS